MEAAVGVWGRLFAADEAETKQSVLMTRIVEARHCLRVIVYVFSLERGGRAKKSFIP